MLKEFLITKNPLILNKIDSLVYRAFNIGDFNMSKSKNINNTFKVLLVTGPRQTGKTTLLNCISTIDTVTTGNIIINGKDITKLKSKNLDKFRQNELGFIFQDFNLLDTLTAYENIALALTIKGEKVSKIDGKIKEDTLPKYVIRNRKSIQKGKRSPQISSQKTINRNAPRPIRNS